MSNCLYLSNGINAIGTVQQDRDKYPKFHKISISEFRRICKKAALEYHKNA